MARPKIPTINWKSELNVLDSYIKSSGGVIHIQTTDDSPSSAFCKALRNIMENEEHEKQWCTVQFDGDNSSTHYLNDMIDQLETTLDLEPWEAINKSNIQVGNNINAGGDVEISNVNINNHPSNHNRERIQRILDFVRENASNKRLAIFLFNTDSANTNKTELSKFKSWIWDNGLSRLIDSGVLLIALSHRSSDTLSWLPDADEVFELPSSYDRESEKNAKEDIANFLLSKGLVKTEEEAQAMAIGIFAGHSNPKDLHANFAGILAKISAC